MDKIELNHAHREDSSHVLDQVIVWEWKPQLSRFDVITWESHKDQIIHKQGDWYYYKIRGVRVKSKIFIETYTLGDPERKNLQLLPEKWRKKLE